MVTITRWKKNENSKGKEFFSLELSGEVEMAVSASSGKIFATVRKTFMACTFDETICKTLIGKQMPGSIQKVESEPYEYTVPSTGETILLDYRYEYTSVEANQSVEAAVLG